ncbi:hypothetical protein C8A05DRAFT_29686 [Staphylotrichum tortipilum]|uniref:Ubiquitin carboxyl-terminal hydrolase n=1 Tax=Staphylotrichum tortipilum TaxID=2831512 RepID=A0AAN6MTP6_9PEZI|nr:hypothetical protein C8A05DRAFT_29686 [Staphylotrichum longicolle]
MAPYSKHFIPLESDPAVFNDLIRLLGVPPSLSFFDILLLDGPHDLPGPALALVLVLPTTEGYERRKAAEDADDDDDRDGKDGEDGEHVVWYRQTINNACGLYAILHALSNGAARDELGTASPMAALIDACAALSAADQRAAILESSAELEEAYASVARQGSSAVPDSAEDEVDFHYVCFVSPRGSGRLYELDGDRRGPIDRGLLILGPGEDLLAPAATDVIRGYMEREGGNVNFSLMALVRCG